MASRGPVVQVEGRAELVRTMREAGANLRDLNAANKAAAAVATSPAVAAAPRRTGRLASAGRPAGTRAAAIIRFATPYAAPIHWGWPGHNIEPNPFALEAARASEPEWTDVYHTAIDKILDGIKGV